MLGQPRFESLEAQQAVQAIELLSALILAAERPVLGHADEPGRQRRSRLANGCTSDWQGRRCENGGSVAVPGGEGAPDCIGSSRSLGSS
jgi:hypothetical protein